MSIKLTKCKPELVRATLEGLGLDHEGSLKATTARLAEFYKQNEDRLDIAGCDNCGGDSDASLDACPFCGEEGVLEDENSPPPAKAPPPQPPKAEAPPPTKKKAAAPAKKPAAKKKAAAPAKKKATTKTKPAAKKKATTKAKPPAKKKGAAKAKAKAPDADAEVVSTALVTEADLERQVEIIRKSVSDGALALHRMGAAAKAINEGQLWKMRFTKGGESCYRSFKQFCIEDLCMTPAHIYRAIGVAEQFTEDEVKGLSGQQIRVVMQLPAGARQEAIDAARSGEGTSTLSERAKALGAKPGEAPTPTKAVTVSMAMGIQKVAMYKRPKKPGKVGDAENATPAKSISDKPWLAIELRNKVRLLVRLDTNKKGELVAAVEFRRGEPTV